MNATGAEKETQRDIIKLLKNMGYEFISEEENKNIRNNKLKDVVLKNILTEQLKKQNSYIYKGKEYEFSEKNINQAVIDLDYPLVDGLMSANQRIYELLTLGKSYEEKLEDGSKRSFSLKYIDFKNPSNNVYHFTEEYWVEKETLLGKEKHRRPDIVLFVNGIPFSVIELKKSSISVGEGISQQIRNQKENNIPHLFKYIQSLVAGKSWDTKYATTGTPSKFWSVWKEEENYEGELKNAVGSREITELDRTIYSLYNLDRALEIIYEYTIFDGKIKKITRYQQYFSIKSTLERIKKLDESGLRKGGLIWHTQGSGKSLTMVMMAQAIARRINSAQVVLVTDRKSLDTQIKDTFKSGGIPVEKASTGTHLVELLNSNRTHVITTVINKFEKAMKNGVEVRCKNTFILVDEAHRSQYGSMNIKMKKVFPEACYIGFTGTPLMKKDKNSITRHGGLIHKYTIDQAVKDKAVLPLLYEGRFVNQWINNDVALNRRFESISKNLSEEQKEDLKVKWGRFQKVASSELRLEVIAFDINEHYKNNWKGTGFKAMLATNSKYEAVKYHQLFEAYGDVKTKFIISNSDTREGHDDITSENKLVVQRAIEEIVRGHGDIDDYETKVKDEFVHGEEVELLIVVDKLLTGFDAPRATTLYIDKELKEHKLLQAIARVNRLFEGKDYGYIVDYRGLLGNLDQALTKYSSLDGFDEGDIANAVLDIKRIIAEVRSMYSRLTEFFSLIKNKNDQEEYEVYLADEKLRDDFYELLKKFSKLMKIGLSSDKVYDELTENEMVRYKRALKFYSEIRKSIRLRYHEAVDFGHFEVEMQKLMDTFISAGEANSLTKIINIFNIESFDEEVNRIEGKRAKADTIRSAITKVITEKYDENPAYYGKLSERIKKVIEDYKEKRIGEEEYLESMNSILTEVRTGKTEISSYPEKIKTCKNSQTIYDNLIEYFDELVGEEGAADMVCEVASEFNSEFNRVKSKPDWQTNQDVHNDLKNAFQDKLWDIEDTYNEDAKEKIEIETDEVIESVLKIAVKRYK